MDLYCTLVITYLGDQLAAVERMSDKHQVAQWGGRETKQCLYCLQIHNKWM